MRIELNQPEAMLQFRVTQPGRETWIEDEGGRRWAEQPSIGSISFPGYMFLNCPLKKTRKVWITLFDYVEDDEYDGDLVENDDENPRILVQYKLTNEASSVQERKVKERETQVRATTREQTVIQTTTTTTKHNFLSSPKKSFTK